MRWSLANRISTCVVSVIALAVVSSLTALFSFWRVADLMHRSLNEHVPSVRAAEELEIAVLEQRGFVASYLLDQGNRHWLTELEAREQNFDDWWEQANATANTSEEREILGQLETVFRQYDAKRDEVVELHRRGEIEAAEVLLVHDVNRLYDATYELCEKFIEANVRYVDTAAADARRQIQVVTLVVSFCVVLTIGLGGVLLWLFFYRIVFPVRALVADAQGFSGDSASESEPLPIDEFRAVGVYLRGLMSDMTDQRLTLERSRQRLGAAEKLASVGKLAASVAHEIRNPLTAIRMWLFSIQKDVGGEESVDRKFEVVSEEIARLEKIVRDFLDFARPPQLDLRRDSISEILDKTLELSAPRLAKERIELARHDANDLPAVVADREQLKQVLLNLLNNALEASAGGGRIDLKTTAEADGDGRRMVVIRVSDSGSGIPPDLQARIFEPFFSTKERGTGLGLCIAARIIAGHEGRLVMEAASEHGTTFSIHIPADQATQS